MIDALLSSRGHACEGCGVLLCRYTAEKHHVYFRSQYRGVDRDDWWNIAILCKSCHHSIHHQGNRNLDRTLKNTADTRKPPSERSKQTIKKPKIPSRASKKNIKLCKSCRCPIRGNGVSGYCKTCYTRGEY